MNEGKMRCKCCGEQAEFTLLEESHWENQYECSNCNKTFREDRKWLKNTKKVGQAVSIIASVVHLASGNIPAAMSIASIIKGGDDTTMG